jgi:hypothetical protein
VERKISIPIRDLFVKVPDRAELNGMIYEVKISADDEPWDEVTPSKFTETLMGLLEAYLELLELYLNSSGAWDLMTASLEADFYIDENGKCGLLPVIQPTTQIMHRFRYEFSVMAARDVVQPL